MFKKIKSYLMIVSAGLLLAGAGPALVAAGSAYAAGCNTIENNINTGASDAGGDTGNGETGCTTGTGTGSVTSGLKTIATQVVNIFSIVVGVISVIMIIYGGFRYITSGGDSGRVGNAKNTLIYAIIGLIIVALAQLIVHYVLSTAASVGSVYVTHLVR
jgi:hypothetical protein